MGKMSERRRKKRKMRQKIAKAMKSLKEAVKVRVAYGRPTLVFKDEKKYDRNQNKQESAKAMKEYD